MAAAQIWQMKGLVLYLLSMLLGSCSTPATTNTEGQDTTARASLDRVQARFEQVCRSDLAEAARLSDSLLQGSTRQGYKPGMAAAYGDIGFVRYYENDFPASLDALLKALSLRVELGDSSGVGDACYWIGKVHRHERNYDLALDYSLRAMRLHEAHGSARRLSSTLNGIGNIFLEQGCPEIALEYIVRRPELESKAGDVAGYATALSDIGDALRLQGRYRESLDHHARALAIMDSIGADNMDWYRVKVHAGLLNSAAQTCQMMGDHAQALRYAQQGLEKLSQTQGRKERRALLQTLAQVHKERKEFREALALQEQYLALNDSLLNEENQERVSRLEESYRVERKEKEVALLTAERSTLELGLAEGKRRMNWIIGTVVGGIVLSVAMGWYLRNRARMRRQHEQYALVIGAEENERKRIAMDLHDGLGQILSTARLSLAALEDDDQGSSPPLANSIHLIDEACKEVRHISHNLMPIALIRGGLVKALQDMVARVQMTGKMKIALQVDGEAEPSPDESRSAAAFRTVQEIVNNALKHSGAKQIQIAVGREGARLMIRVHDDGVGLTAEQLAQSQGIGWINLVSRVELLGGHLQVDSAPGSGTTHTLTIPLD